MPATLLTRLAIASTLVLVSPSLNAQSVTLEARDNLHWMRGNMHTHTYWSDGDDYPEMVAAWYLDHNYQFLVFTDHNTLLRGEKWISVGTRKTGPETHARLVARFGEDWIQSRKGADDKLEVRLKSFDEVFNRVAVPQKFLVIQGEEITDTFERRPVHLCATNLTELLPPAGGDSIVDVMNRNLALANSLRERTGTKTLVHLNHPNFHFAITAEQLMQVADERFFEVYNGHSGVDNRGDETHVSTERMWDIVNTWRLAKLHLPPMYGIATDDGHNYSNKAPGKGAQPGRGWVMVLASSLTPDTLVDALESGQFYSSSGVRLNSIRWDGRQLSVDVADDPSAEFRIDFIGTRRSFDDTTTPASVEPAKQHLITRTYSPDVGTVLRTHNGRSATYTSDGTELYIRAVVTSSRLHPNPSQPGDFEMAWTQPVLPAPE